MSQNKMYDSHVINTYLELFEWILLKCLLCYRQYNIHTEYKNDHDKDPDPREFTL